MNKDLFDQFCFPAVNNVFEGFNSSIFAYGQTSSGKTHTMSGSGTEEGIMQMVFRELLSRSPDYQELGIWVSYLEIYNEAVNDLLDASSSNLRIVEDQETNLGSKVIGLKMVRVTTMEQVLMIFRQGQKRRQTRATQANDYSSRSHTVMRIIIETKRTDEFTLVSEKQELHKTSSTKYAILNLVDLAGSERLTSDDFVESKETKNINQSLFVLAKVIKKLSDQDKGHIPY